MANWSCRNCGAANVGDSYQCQMCGQGRPRPSSTLWIWLSVGGAAVTLWALGSCVAFLGDASRNAPSSPSDRRAEACSMSWRFMRENLKAPSTAKMVACAAEPTPAAGAYEAYIVGMDVDAQNSFGAMLRQRYIIEARRGAAGGEWEFRLVAK